MASTAAYSDAEMTKDKLNDDLQLLFVTLVLEHAEAVCKSIDEKKQPPPLYLLLLGTAGTGKTTATQTMLQELQGQVKATGLISEFFRVAAPTGTAAFNVRFNATTLHRLMRWFNPSFFQELTDPDRLHALQKSLEKTQILVIDEISMWAVR